MPPLLLDEQIRSNRRRTGLLFAFMLVFLAVLVLAIGFVLGYPPIVTFPFAIIFGLVYLGSAGAFSVDAILASARAKPIDERNPTHRRLQNIVEELCIAAQMPLPKVYVNASPDINAFATGKNAKQGVICVTQGALERLDREELQGVIAHELSHIKNEDIRIQTYAIAFIGIVAMIGELLWWNFIFGGRGRGNDNMDPRIKLAVFVVAIVLIILAPLLSRLTYFAISRQREYLADSTGAMLTRNPEGLARALEKIRDSPNLEPHKGDRTVASLYFANPLKKFDADAAFASHPPLDKRIARLRRQG